MKDLPWNILSPMVYILLAILEISIGLLVLSTVEDQTVRTVGTTLLSGVVGATTTRIKMPNGPQK